VKSGGTAYAPQQTAGERFAFECIRPMRCRSASALNGADDSHPRPGGGRPPGPSLGHVHQKFLVFVPAAA
jgi:hypothetical protein